MRIALARSENAPPAGPYSENKEDEFDTFVMRGKRHQLLAAATDTVCVATYVRRFSSGDRSGSEGTGEAAAKPVFFLGAP